MADQVGEAIDFAELVALMVLGRGGPDQVRGDILAVDDSRQHRFRVWRRGSLSREEDLDGTVRDIVGPQAHWHRDEDTGAVWVRPPERDVDVQFATTPIGGLDVGGVRPSWERWKGTDFTRPTRPVEALDFLGRRAYAVELAPPAHKPYPMQLIVDADTGLLLRARNVAFGWSREWVELIVDAELPDELFDWSGAETVRPVPTPAQHQADWERDTALRRDWLTARGITALSIPLAADLSLHDWDDATGAFYASFDAHAGGTLLRRARRSGPWPEPATTNYPYSRRWSDDRWDWFMAGEADLGDDEFDQLRNRSATTT